MMAWQKITAYDCKFCVYDGICYHMLKILSRFSQWFADNEHSENGDIRFVFLFWTSIPVESIV